MNNVKARNMKIIAQQKFARVSTFKCDSCAKPATRMIVWYQEDGDSERERVCEIHAVERQGYLSDADWDAAVEVTDIELWKLVVIHQGMTAIRIGSRYEGRSARELVEEHP